jgi:hypothetical protein
MDAKLMAALAALSTDHPTHAPALIQAAAKPDATADGLHALAANLVTQAQATEIAGLKAQVATLTTERDAAKAEAATAKADLAALKAHAQPKAIEGDDSGKPLPTMTLEAFGKLSLKEQAAVIERGTTLK